MIQFLVLTYYTQFIPMTLHVGLLIVEFKMFVHDV